MLAEILASEQDEYWTAELTKMAVACNNILGGQLRTILRMQLVSFYILRNA